MPVEILLLHGCWILGDVICVVNHFLAFLIVGVSVGNILLISVDRYVAICEPMFYTTKVTMKRVQICICLCWILSAFHASWMLRDTLVQPGRYNSCYGECVLVVNYEEGVFDLFISFFGPITVILVLYTRVFVVAVSQARAMHSQTVTVTIQHSNSVNARRSQMKAAMTLGIVMVVFLLCSCPYYAFIVAAESSMLGGASAVSEVWLLYINSCLNPVIYVFFYPWFRKSIKHIVTLRTLKPSSFGANIM